MAEISCGIISSAGINAAGAKCDAKANGKPSMAANRAL
jgi:hypothetical protein